MKATLVQDTGRQRFYELSEYINKGRGFSRDVDISASLKTLLETRILPEYKEQFRAVLSDERGTKWVCVSDAITHIERLVFPAFPGLQGDYSFSCDNIDGKQTMMIYGGDSREVYADEVYLRHLARLNGLKWEGIENASETNQ